MVFLFGAPQLQSLTRCVACLSVIFDAPYHVWLLVWMVVECHAHSLQLRWEEHVVPSPCNTRKKGFCFCGRIPTRVPSAPSLENANKNASGTSPLCPSPAEAGMDDLYEDKVSTPRNSWSQSYDEGQQSWASYAPWTSHTW